jgi:photosystem II stability/assembly factor-like uncharacterized protein
MGAPPKQSDQIKGATMQGSLSISGASNRAKRLLRALRQAPSGVLASLCLTSLLTACGGSDPEVTALPDQLASQAPQGLQALGTPLSFSAGLSDGRLRYEWQFGDGSTSTLAAPSHAFSTPGSYQVRLTVTNELGDARSAQSVVTVADLALARGRACSAGDSSGWCWQRPLPQGNAIADVTIAANGKGWAVGELGTLLATTDGGATWTRLPAPSDQDLVKVFAVSEQVVWLAATNDLILMSSDGGRRWQTSNAGFGVGEVASLGASSASVAWVQTPAGQRYATSDGGRRWSRTPTPPLGDLYTLTSAADGSVWALPYYIYNIDSRVAGKAFAPSSDNTGGIFIPRITGYAFARSSDNGITWLNGAMPQLAPGIIHWVNKVQAGSSSRVLMTTSGSEVGSLRNIYAGAGWLSKDGGSTWRAINPPPGFASIGLIPTYLMASSGELLAHGGGRSMARSADDGATWSAVPWPTQQDQDLDLISIEPLGAGRYLVTTRGIVTTRDSGQWYTSDAGLHWQELKVDANPTAPSLSSVNFFNRREGLAIADNGSSLRTADGGQTWVNNSPLTFSSNFKRRARFLPGTDLGWVTSETNTIFYTTNRGQTWSAPAPQTSMPINQPADVCFVDTQRGWAVSGAYSLEGQPAIFRTTNGGQSWQGIAGTGGYGLLAVAFSKDGRHGVATGYNGVFMTSADAGATWSRHNLNAVSFIRRLVFLDDGTTVFGASDGGVVLRSSDQGRSWQEIATATGADLKDLFFTSKLRGWAVGKNGTILKTVDGGLSWLTQNSGTRADFLGLHFLDDSTGWVVGSNGTVLVTVNGGN